MHGRHDRRVEPVLGSARQPTMLDRVHPARAGQDRHGRGAGAVGLGAAAALTIAALEPLTGRSGDQRRHPLPVEGRGHDEEPQIGANRTADVERQRQTQVALEVAFVELVEDDESHTGELGIVLQSAGQDTLRHDLDPGATARATFVPGPEADQPPHLLTHEVRHPSGGRPGGEAAGFEHHDAPARQPRFVDQAQRHDGGLAGPRLRLQHCRAVPRQGVPELGDAGLDRQLGAAGRPGAHGRRPSISTTSSSISAADTPTATRPSTTAGIVRTGHGARAATYRVRRA